jgi:hypothetical protein
MASTISSDMILNGENPFEDIAIPDIARELLASFVHSSPLDAVSDEVTLDEWTGKMKSWKETTSTSPSGMHLGQRKAHRLCFMDISGKNYIQRSKHLQDGQKCGIPAIFKAKVHVLPS